MNPDAEDRIIEMAEQNLHDTPSDNPASPPPDLHAPSTVSVSSAVTGGSIGSWAVIRGARGTFIVPIALSSACTICRTARMRCIGGDDQNSDVFPCNRCKNANVPCIFEKHRRGGRKPGSKLSEATKARRASKEAAATGAPASSPAGSSSRSLHSLPKVEEQHEFMDLDTSGHAPPSAVSTVPPNSGRPRSFSTKENPGPAPYHNHNPNGSGLSSAGPHAFSPTGPPAISPHVFPGPYAPQYMPDAGSSGAPAVSSPTSPTRPENVTRKGFTAFGDDEDSRSDGNLFPGSMVQKEKNKFLSMVLNPPNSAPTHRGHNSGRPSNLFPGSIVPKEKNKFLSMALNPPTSAPTHRGHNSRRPSTEQAKASERWAQNLVWEPPSVPALIKYFDPPKEALPDPLDSKFITEPEAEVLLARSEAVSISSNTASLAPVPKAGDMITWISPMPVKVNGHFCDVFEGTHSTAGKVALKRPRIGTAEPNEDTIRRFQREATTWGRLRHPHILEYLGTFQKDGHFYFVSPFIENGTLVEYIVLHPNVNRIKLLCETADAISYLHKEDVVHGDIKANNLLIGGNGRVLLCDFGLTRTTDLRTSTAMKGAGTLRWQSPELWDGGSKSFQSDVYAFSMTIVEVLTGDVPFPNLQTDGAVIRAVLIEGKRPPKNPAVSSVGLSYEKVWAVAEACWPAVPEERISMSEALQRIQEDPALAAMQGI